MRTAVAAAGAALLAACAAGLGTAGIGVSDGPEVAWDVVPVVWSAAEVLERYRIPVDRADEMEGVVESGTFRVQRQWDRFSADQIVACPNFESRPPEEIAATAFDVRLVIHARDMGGGNTRIRVGGSAESVDPTGQRQALRCAVREEFRQFIAEEVRREVMNLPPRHPTSMRR